MGLHPWLSTAFHLPRPSDLWTSKGWQVGRKAALHGSTATGHRTQGPEVPQAAQRQAAIEAETLQGHLGGAISFRVWEDLGMADPVLN